MQSQHQNFGSPLAHENQQIYINQANLLNHTPNEF